MKWHRDGSNMLAAIMRGVQIKYMKYSFEEESFTRQLEINDATVFVFF